MKTNKILINHNFDVSNLERNYEPISFSSPLKIGDFQLDPNSNSKFTFESSSLTERQKQIYIFIENQSQNKRSERSESFVKKNKLPIGMKNFLRKNRQVSLQNIATLHRMQANKVEIKKVPSLQKRSNKIQFFQNQSFQELKKEQFSKIHGEVNKVEVIDTSIGKKVLKNKKQTLQTQTISKVPICSICQSQIQQNKKCNAFECQHKFCFRCLEQYTKYKIKMFQEVFCPEELCEVTINIDSGFFNQLNLKQRKNYLKIHQFYFIHANKQQDQRIRLCPLQRCDGIIKIIETNPTQKCNSCLQFFCSECFYIQHSGPCETYDVNYMRQSLKLIQCTKCNAFIEKNEGCFHITCKCSFQFCQKCKQAWKTGHICKFSIINEISTNGCDWGLNWNDHCTFLMKIPLKIIICALITLFWLIFTVVCFPVNIIVFFYWLFLILILPNYEQFTQANENSVLCLSLIIILIPLVILKNIPKGIVKVIDFIDHYIPEFRQSYTVELIKLKIQRTDLIIQEQILQFWSKLNAKLSKLQKQIDFE